MKKLIVFIIAALVSTGAMAETQSFNMSLTPDVVIYGRSVMIKGVTLSLWRENEQMSLALGIVNGPFGQSSGLD